MANKILVIDDTKVDLTEKKSSQVNDATQYMTPAQIVSDAGASSGIASFYWAGRLKSPSTSTATATTIAGTTDITATSSGAFTWIQFTNLTTNLVSKSVLNIPHETLGNAIITLANGYYCKVYPQYSGSNMRILTEWFTSGGTPSNMFTAVGGTNELTFEIKIFE